MSVNKCIGIGTVLLAFVAFGATARAGLLSTDPQAYNDGTMTWSGTQAYSAGSGASSLKATVDFAVYAPGQFHDSAALGDPTDPSGGTQYVYAYQVWNNTGGSLAISTFTVGYANAAGSSQGGDKLPANIGYLAAFPSGTAPSSESFSFPGGSGPAQSGIWNYSTGVPVGGNSSVLIYTSPYPPAFDVGTIQGGRTNTQLLPSPVPEPNAVVLLFIGIAFLAAKRLWRQNRCSASQAT